MGLILAAAVAVATMLTACLILLAGGMSDSQNTADRMRPKLTATLSIGAIIAVALVFTHFHQIGW